MATIIITFILIIFILGIGIVLSEMAQMYKEDKTEWEKYWDETFERNRNL